MDKITYSKSHSRTTYYQKETFNVSLMRDSKGSIIDSQRLQFCNKTLKIIEVNKLHLRRNN